MTRDDRFNDFLNGRVFMTLCGLLLAAVALFSAGHMPPMPAVGGMFFDMPDALVRPGVMSALLNVGCLVAIVALMLLANKQYSFIRSLTFIYASAFFLLEVSTPLNSGVLNAGSILCLALALGVLALFASYDNVHSQGRIYLTMVILSAASLWHWAFVVLIPAFFLGFLYLQAMNFKGVLAALLGLATPLWVIAGLGIVNPLTDFRPLQINTVWSITDHQQTELLIAWTATVVVLTMILTVINLTTIMNYRLQFRVYNGFFVVVSLFSALAICIDYRDTLVFLPMLNLCLAIQLGQSFTLSSHPKRYIAVWLFVAVTLAVGFGSLAI